MNVCFYTSTVPSIANLLNIGHLINERPQHNYTFLSVVNNKPQPSFKERLRTRYGKIRANDGRFDMERDQLAIEQVLMSHVKHIDQKQFNSERVNQVNDASSEQFLEKIKPDVIIQAGAGILKGNIFSKAGIATINVHHGMAPDIRGIDSTFWCLFYGAKEKIGVTCHIIDERLDTGAVIQRQALQTTATSYIGIQSENYLMGMDMLALSIDILEKGALRIEESEPVKSYYFGLADPFLYYALKKRGFHPLMKLSQKSFTMKESRFVVPAAL